MKRHSATIWIVCTMFVVLSCGLIDRVTDLGIENLQRSEDLWPDVPRMDGLEHSDMELPLGVKLIMKAALNNLWRLNKEGEDKTPVSGDWVVYSTTKPPADVQAFYTNDRMTSFGVWEASKKSTCADGSDKGWPGIFCVFQKNDPTTETVLLIVAGQDEAKKTTNVFFLRLEKPVEKPRP